MFNITKTNILPFNNGKYDCIALCEITLDDAIEITGLKLYLKDNKYWLVFPKNPHNKKKKKFANPKNDDVYQYILNRIINDFCNMKTNNNDIDEAENNFYKNNFGQTPEEDINQAVEEFQLSRSANDILSFKETVMKDIDNMDITNPTLVKEFIDNLKESLTDIKKVVLTDSEKKDNLVNE